MALMLRLAWRNLWRQPRRTWLTAGAMVFSNVLLIFMISLQFGMYGMMIENTLAIFTGHLQVQVEGYKDDQKIRQVIPAADELAEQVRAELQLDSVAVGLRLSDGQGGGASGLAESFDRPVGILELCAGHLDSHQRRTFFGGRGTGTVAASLSRDRSTRVCVIAVRPAHAHGRQS